MTYDYEFIATINGDTIYPKGFYYQDKYIILVGDVKSNHTIRRKEKITEVNIKIIDKKSRKKKLDSL